MMVEHAIELASHGFPVFPLAPRTKIPPAKVTHYKVATRDPVEIAALWKKHGSACNVGLLMGAEHGFIGLDIDLNHGATMAFFEHIPPSWCVRSINGFHVYYRTPEHWPKQLGKLDLVKATKGEACVTIRAFHHYFAGPGSIHPEGGTYEWAKNQGQWPGVDADTLGPEDLPLAIAPDWLLAGWNPGVAGAGASNDQRGDTSQALSHGGSNQERSRPSRNKIHTNNRHSELTRTATACRKEGRDLDYIVERLNFRNQNDCEPPIGSEAGGEKRDAQKEIYNIAKWAVATVTVDEKAKRKAEVRMEQGDIVWASFPDENEKGIRKGTIENVKELLRRLNVVCRYNGIAKEQEILIPDLNTSVDNRANVTIAWLTSWCKRCGIPTGELGGYLTAICDENLYNPVAVWIESIPWDGRSRLKEFYATIAAPNCRIKDVLIRKWLISAVAAGYEPDGVVARGVLVLQGPQYIGKTTWFKKLAPKDLRKDGVTLRMDDKDSIFKAISYWLVELGELDATFRKSDIAQLKSFIPQDQDTIRRPYAKLESHFARRTVFFASVNDATFLNDPTGNSRFWVIECERIDFDHEVDMQQLWAEVLTLYRSGEKWTLDQEAMKTLNHQNEDFQTVDPIEERIETYYGWELPHEQVVIYHQNATEVCVAIGISNPTKADTNSATRAIRKLSGQKPDRRRKYSMPHKKSI